MEATEVEIEVMEPIALFEEVEEGGGETCDKEKGNKVYQNMAECGIQSLISILREKLHKLKSIFLDQLVHYGIIEKPDTTRFYQVWPGRNVFFFHGRFVCGPDTRGLMLTSVSIVLSSWIFARYVGKDVTYHSTLVVTFNVMLTFIVLVNLILVSTTDPGIIPRNEKKCSQEADGITKFKKVIVNGMEAKLKYCRICRIYRPPRSCHCAICDNCVEKYDHHCPWIGQCIALRNHRFYMAFVVFALVFYVYIFAFSCWRLHQRMLKDGDGIIEMVKVCPETLALVAFGLIAIGFLGPLAIYHIYLIAINQTAYENFRQLYVVGNNPYDKGFLMNLKEAFFGALPPPNVDFRAEVTVKEGSYSYVVAK